MDINRDEVTLLSFLITWAVGIFGAGKLYGNILSKTQKNTDDIVGIKKEFKTTDGEVRLLSYAAHDKIQQACQKIQDERYDHMESRLDRHDKKLDAILDAVSK